MNRLILEEAAQILKSGGVVIFPTDTVYGIGCRFDNQKAIERLYQIKGTPQNQPFPILVSNINQVKKLTKLTKSGQDLIDKYWPGAVTIILPFRHPEPFDCHSERSEESQGKLREGSIMVSDSSAAPQNDTSKVGFRIPDSDLIRSLIKKVGVPIVGTSANIHGRVAPTSFNKLDPQIVKLADFTIKGKCALGIESTVVDATFDPPKILRQGAVRLVNTSEVSQAASLHTSEVKKKWS